MLDHTEFPYYKHFFDSNSQLDALLLKIVPILEFIYFDQSEDVTEDNFCGFSGNIEVDKNEYIQGGNDIRKLIKRPDFKVINDNCQLLSYYKIEFEQYLDVLFITFDSDLNNSFKKIPSQNRDLFFKGLLGTLNDSDIFYKDQLSHCYDNKIGKSFLEMLIQSNSQKLEIIKSTYLDFVPYLQQYFHSVIPQLVTLTYDSIFISKSMQEWVLNTISTLGWENYVRENKHGTEAKLLSFYDDSHLRSKLFKVSTSKKDFVEFINRFYKKDVIKIKSNYSTTSNAQHDLKNHAVFFPVPIE